MNKIQNEWEEEKVVSFLEFVELWEDVELFERIAWRQEVIEYLEEYPIKHTGRFLDVVEHIMEEYPEKTFDYTGHYPDDSKAELEEELIIVGKAFEYILETIYEEERYYEERR
tara:strand:- start:392 stop:730 length:339 start_codon:yes stop_codon:yes gene_type:complete